MAIQPKPYCPPGYEPVNDWIHKEAGRRGFPVERQDMPNEIYCSIFDDLGNYVGAHDNESTQLAVCNVNGRIEPVPIEKWRQSPEKRLREFSTGYIVFYHGLLAGTTNAKVFVRVDLRLPKESCVIDVVPVRMEQDKPADVDQKSDPRRAPRAQYMRLVPEYIQTTGAPGRNNKERWAKFLDWLEHRDDTAYQSCKIDQRSTQFEQAVRDARKSV